MCIVQVEHPPQNSTSSATKMHHKLSWHPVVVQAVTIWRNVMPPSSVDGYLSWDVIGLYRMSNCLCPKRGKALSRVNSVSAGNFPYSLAVQYTWFHRSISEYWLPASKEAPHLLKPSDTQQSSCLAVLAGSVVMLSFSCYKGSGLPYSFSYVNSPNNCVRMDLR
jgi:hypothetical protein